MKSKKWWLLALSLLAVMVVLVKVDLSPKVESDFFFSTDDPQLATSAEIDKLFPASSQLFLRVAGEVHAADYQASIGTLTQRLQGVPGVEGVYSLTSGPKTAAGAFTSPFWSRLLVAQPAAGGEPAATNLVVSLQGEAAAKTVRAVEEAVAMAGASQPEGKVEISGVPYVVELVRRYLLRDLKTFSAVAILLFGLMVGLLFRSPWIVAGTLATCLVACAATLAILALFAVPIGVLTANLVTIVFVLTLSHIVFLTSNWRRIAGEGTDDEGTGGDAVREAMRRTFEASFWSMATTLLGFLSLLFAAAKPMRELGISGAVGALVAILVAYGLYPFFLRGLSPVALSATAPPAGSGASVVAGHRRLALAVVLLCLLAGLGIGRLNTDPGLLSFFKPGSELRQGLEAIDRDGGSSPLSIVVADPAGERIDNPEVVAKLDALQAAFEADPATGVVLSASPLLAEARASSPFAALLPAQGLLDLLSGPAFQGAALAFVTPERTQANFILRMREGDRPERREEVLGRLREAVESAGLEVRLMGGLYELQGKLSGLVARSLATGLGGLLVLFVLIAARVSRRLRTTLVMVAGLVLIPLALLGAMGWLRLPLDIISSPAANIAIALGVDSMIHLATAARRHRLAGLSLAAAWAQGRREMARPVLGATLVVASGFGIFALSSFPPTQRFGIAVVLGTVAAAAVTLSVLPWGAAKGGAVSG